MIPDSRGQAFPDASDFAAARIAIFIASIVAGALGVAILWRRRVADAEDVAAEFPSPRSKLSLTLQADHR